MSQFPLEVVGWVAYRADGSPIYSDTLETANLQFYADGHPLVRRLERAIYQLVRIEDVPVDSSPERQATWAERNDR